MDESSKRQAQLALIGVRQEIFAKDARQDWNPHAAAYVHDVGWLRRDMIAKLVALCEEVLEEIDVAATGGSVDTRAYAARLEELRHDATD